MKKKLSGKTETWVYKNVFGVSRKLVVQMLRNAIDTQIAALKVNIALWIGGFNFTVFTAVLIQSL